MVKIKKQGTRKSSAKAGTTGAKAGRRRRVESAIPGAKVIELVPDAFGTGRWASLVCRIPSRWYGWWLGIAVSRWPLRAAVVCFRHRFLVPMLSRMVLSHRIKHKGFIFPIVATSLPQLGPYRTIWRILCCRLVAKGCRSGGRDCRISTRCWIGLYEWPHTAPCGLCGVIKIQPLRGCWNIGLYYYPTLRLAACVGFLRDVAWSRQREQAPFALDFATFLRDDAKPRQSKRAFFAEAFHHYWE